MNFYIFFQIWTTGEDHSIADVINKEYKTIFSNYDAWYFDCGYAGWVTDGSNWCSPYKGILKPRPKYKLLHFYCNHCKTNLSHSLGLKTLPLLEETIKHIWASFWITCWGVMWAEQWTMATLVLRSCLKQSLSIMDFPEPEMKNREQVMTDRDWVPETRVLGFGTAQCGPENLKKSMPKINLEVK